MQENRYEDVWTNTALKVLVKAVSNQHLLPCCLEMTSVERMRPSLLIGITKYPDSFFSWQ